MNHRFQRNVERQQNAIEDMCANLDKMCVSMCKVDQSVQIIVIVAKAIFVNQEHACQYLLVAIVQVQCIVAMARIVSMESASANHQLDVVVRKIVHQAILAIHLTTCVDILEEATVLFLGNAVMAFDVILHTINAFE